MRHGALLRRQRQDRSEDRADARRPAEGEGEADDERAQRPGRLALHVDLGLPVERVDLQQPHRVQAEEDHGDAGDLGQDPELLVDQRADAAGRGAERDEHAGEAEDEGDRGEEDAPRRALRQRRAGVGVVERDAGDERQVARYQRQHAGRHERQDPGHQGREIGDVFHEGWMPSPPTSFRPAGSPCPRAAAAACRRTSPAADR